MTEISEAVAVHRADYWTWVELHAVPSKRDILLRLRDHWCDINSQWFDDKMELPYITLTEPSKPSTYGQTCETSSWGSRMEIRIRPSLVDGTHPHVSGDAEGCWRFVADVLMHETIHQYNHEILAAYEDSYHGHGPVFAGHANRIGVRLGLPEVVARNRKGSNLPKTAQWPMCVRDRAYYLGAYHPRVPVVRDTMACPCCDGTGRVPKTHPAFYRLAIALDEPGYAHAADALVPSTRDGGA